MAVFHLVVAMAGGSLNAQDSRATDRGVPSVVLRGERLGMASLRFPTSIASVGAFVVVCDTEMDTIGFVIRKSSGRIVARFGPRSDGAMRIVAPVSIIADSDNETSFWVVDGALHRALRYRVVSIEGALTPDSILLFAVPGQAPVTSAFRDTDGSFVLTGFFDGPRFLRIAVNGSVTPFGPQATGSTRVPATVRQHAFQTSLTRHVSESGFAAATRFSDRLEVFASNGVAVSKAARSRGFDPVYDVVVTSQGPRMRPSANMRYAYLSITAHDAGVLALYSGRTSVEAPGRSWAGAIVESYGWDAQRRAAFALDKDVVAIAAENDGRVLYGVVHGQSPGILRFVLR